jgi:hypothetical protein
MAAAKCEELDVKKICVTRHYPKLEEKMEPRFSNVLAIGKLLAVCVGLSGIAACSMDLPNQTSNAATAIQSSSQPIQEAGKRENIDPTYHYTNPFSTNASLFGSLKDGDILLSNHTNSMWDYIYIIDKWRWLHGGIFDKVRYDAGNHWCILTASDSVSNYDWLENLTGCVGYESIDQWEQYLGVVVVRVTNASATTARTAIKNMQQYIGRPYATPISLVPSLSNNEYWYCTKVVYRTWQSVNITVARTETYQLLDGLYDCTVAIADDIDTNQNVADVTP